MYKRYIQICVGLGVIDVGNHYDIAMLGCVSSVEGMET